MTASCAESKRSERRPRTGRSRTRQPLFRSDEGTTNPGQPADFHLLGTEQMEELIELDSELEGMICAQRVQERGARQSETVASAPMLLLGSDNPGITGQRIRGRLWPINSPASRHRSIDLDHLVARPFTAMTQRVLRCFLLSALTCSRTVAANWTVTDLVALGAPVIGFTEAGPQQQQRRPSGRPRQIVGYGYHHGLMSAFLLSPGTIPSPFRSPSPGAGRRGGFVPTKRVSTMTWSTRRSSRPPTGAA